MLQPLHILNNVTLTVITHSPICYDQEEKSSASLLLYLFVQNNVFHN
jgi:hypothetical protein